MSVKNSIYFLLLITGVYFLIVSPMLFSHGMFLDGIYYAMVARNLAEGYGDFWNPLLTDTLGSNFHEHPPLVFGIQSLFFKLFGDYHWVERLYSLLCFIGGGWLTVIIWKKVGTKNIKPYYWVPLLLWITVPKMTWGTCNNLLENTMMLFVLTSLIFQIRGAQKKRLYWFSLAGASLFFGFLSKGFTSFFPLSFPFFYWLIHRQFSFLFLIKIYFTLFISLGILFLGLFFLIPESYESLSQYYQIQIINGLGAEQSVNSRFYIIRRVSEELAVMASVSLLFYLLNRFKFKIEGVFSANRKWMLTLLATALSGVLPILISMKQSTFYVIPTFPLFSISFGLIISPLIVHWFQNVNNNSKGFGIFRIISIIIFFVGIIVLLLPINKVNRDKSKIADIQKIIELVGPKTTVGLQKELSREWSYYAYLYRYGYVSLNSENIERYQYLICIKDQETDQNHLFEKVDLQLKQLDLYRLKK